MWFLSARKTRHTALSRSAHNQFRPRLEALEDRCLLSAGALDPTFGSGGTVSMTSGIRVEALVVYPNTGTNPATDAKIVIGGFVENSGLNTDQCALERFNPDGSVDTTFGTSGTVILSNGPNEILYGLAIDANSKIVAVGSSAIPISSKTWDQEFAVVRYNTDGSLDPTFGGTGIVLTNVNPYRSGSLKSGDSGRENAAAVAIQPDGKIDVGGLISVGDNAEAQFALVRYNANGTLDTSFGNQSPKNGINITPAFGGPVPPGGGGSDVPTALALQSDGKILLAGTAAFTNSPGLTSSPYPSMAVARYTAAGQLDSTSFGTSSTVPGTVTLVPAGAQQAWAAAIVVQSNGTIVLGGGSSVAGGAWYSALARLQSNGQLDTTFAKSGFTTSSLANGGKSLLGGGLAQGANGDLLIAGSTTDSSASAVEAYLPGGAVDKAFGSGGIATVVFSASFQQLIRVQRDGKIVVAGSTQNNLAPYSQTVGLARLVPSNTQIGWPTASPNPVSAGNNVTLTASNIYDNAYPSTTVTQVSYYQDTNGNGTLDVGTDTLLGTGTLNTMTGVWTFTFSATGWAKGTYTLFAQAWDGSFYYDPISIQVTVQ